MNEATPKQIKWLYAVTHIQAARWMEKKITIPQAAQILDLGFAVLGKKPDLTKRPAFEAEVRKYFPEFICPDKMKWIYGGKRKKKAKADPAQGQMLPQEPAEPPAMAPKPDPARFTFGDTVVLSSGKPFPGGSFAATVEEIRTEIISGKISYTLESSGELFTEEERYLDPAFEKHGPKPTDPAEYQVGQKVRITKNPLYGYTGKIGTITHIGGLDGNKIYTVETPNIKDPHFTRHYSLLKGDFEPVTGQEAQAEPENDPAPIPEQKPEPEKKKKKAKSRNKNGYIKPDIYESATRTIKAGINLLIHGPAGCGKSRMVKEITDDLKKEFVTVSFSGGTRYAQVFGSTKLEDGNSRFEAGPLLKAVQLKNAVILLDEIFSGDPDVVMGLNSLLEPDSREIQTPAGIIKVHESCTFVAAANTTGRAISRQYTGAQRSDDSLIDRFTHLAMDYDPKAEKSILKAMDLNGDAGQLQDKIGKLRKKIKENNIPFDPSTRRLINAARLVRDAEFTADEAFDMAFLNSLSEAEKGKVS